MKVNLIIYLFSIVCISSTGYSQLCPSGNLEFYQQSDVNQFVQNYPNCHKINGSVEFSNYIFNSSDDIDDLTGLIMIDSIMGDLFIASDYDEISSLQGLNNLSFVGGTVGIGNLCSLTSYLPLNNLKEIGGGLNLTSYCGIPDFNGLGVEKIGGDLRGSCLFS